MGTTITKCYQLLLGGCLVLATVSPVAGQQLRDSTTTTSGAADPTAGQLPAGKGGGKTAKETSAAVVRARVDSIRRMVGRAYNEKPYQMVDFGVFRDSIRYKDLQAIIGTLVRQSRGPSTSAAVDEKGATLNIGAPLIGHQLAIQAVVKGQNEDGLVNLFDKDGKYQSTIGGGLALNWFVFTNNTGYKYYEDERDSLHYQLRERLRLYDMQVGGCQQVDAATKLPTAIEAAAAEMATFMKANPDLLKHLRDRTTTPPTQADCDKVEQYKTLLSKLAPVMPSGWDKWDPEAQASWIKNNLMTAAQRGQFVEKLKVGREKALLRVLDSLQMSVQWTKRKLHWVNLVGTYNAWKQPIFTPDPTKDYVSKEPVGYWDWKLSYNGLITRFPYQRKAKGLIPKLYWAGGIGYNTQRPFKEEDKLTYQKVVQDTIGGVVIPTVSTKEFYPTKLGKPQYFVLDAQLAAFFTWIGIDFTLRNKQDMSGNKYKPEQQATMGVFFPIKSDDTVLTLEPQLKWNSVTGRSIGVVLSAAVPGYLTKKKKG